MKRAGVIRVLTTLDEELLNLHGKLISRFFPQIETVSACIPDQYEGVHDDETERLAVPKVMALAWQMESDGFDAVVVSCAGDPGVDELSNELSIPVIGAGRAVAAAARALALPIGVLGLTVKVPSAIKTILGESLVANVVPDGVSSSLDLMTTDGFNATLSAGRYLKRRGAKAIALACTGMTTIDAATRLSADLDIPVIDPVKAEAALTWTVLQ